MIIWQIINLNVVLIIEPEFDATVGTLNMKHTKYLCLAGLHICFIPYSHCLSAYKSNIFLVSILYFVPFQE